MGQRSYLLVTPVRDEADALEDLVASIKAQEVRPRLWLIVDDGSSDQTPALLERLAARERWVHVLHRRVDRRPHEPSRYAAVMAMAFRAAAEVAEAEGLEYGYVANLDADVRCPPSLMAELIERCERDRMVGMASCTMHELDVEGVARSMGSATLEPSAMRRGLRMWRRDCLEQVALYPSPSWAAVTTVRARNRGWRAVVHADLVAEVVRADGERGGFWKGYRRLGMEQWQVGLHPALLAAQALRASARDRDLRGLALMSGYVECALRGDRQISDPELRSFFRKELPREALAEVARRLLPPLRRPRA